MHRLFAHAGWVLVLGLVACGGTPVTSSRPYSVQQALTQNAEMLEFEPATVRQELFHELGRLALQQQGRGVDESVLFPVVDANGQLVAAPGLDGNDDLLESTDAGAAWELVFSGTPGEGWSEDRRDSLQGLSEREAAEQVARSLLERWGMEPEGRPIQVDRAAGAPYAAAYVDGILRINPAFVSMAASLNAGAQL